MEGSLYCDNYILVMFKFLLIFGKFWIFFFLEDYEVSNRFIKNVEEFFINRC